MTKKPTKEIVDEIAISAMQAMLRGIFSHPGSMEMFEKIALGNNRPSSTELVKRSYDIADEMINFKRKREHEATKGSIL